MGSRVFVRLFDGARAVETNDVVLTLPPPPLKWHPVLSAMVAALDRADADDDDDDAAAATVAPERLVRARLFLLPSETLGIVAELNARGLRGIRENDRFVVCLEGEDYQKRVEAAESEAAAGDHSGAPAGSGPAPSDAAVLSSVPRLPITNDPLKSSSSQVVYGQSSFASTTPSSLSSPSSSLSSAAAAANAPIVTSTGPPKGMGGFVSLGVKGNKRYRSISGKMAAIKSLGEKGLISAADRGHLKDLLLNNDSPQLQEALDEYNNTGDFQAVKAILTAELRHPSTKRNVGSDWISDTLVSDITANFTTADSRESASSPMQNAALPANPFLYQSAASSSSNSAYLQPQQASPMAMGFVDANASASPETRDFSSSAAAVHQRDPIFQQLLPEPPPHQPGMALGGFGQPQYSQDAYGNALPQVNLPMRNRNNMNLLLKHGGFGAPPPAPMMGLSPTHLDMRYSGGPGFSNQLEAVAPAPMYASSMGYAPPDYGGRVGMSQQFGFVLPGSGGGFNGSAMQQQQQQQQFGMHRYSYGATGMVTGAGGYEYYPGGVGGFGFGGFDKSNLRNGGKWTSAPPMPSYPPACSKEEKKEKIAKWLKKRENRNWSNKPSYPVRHSIAKSRKRGEDGRFITKARLAEMALEAAAANATAGGPNDSNNAPVGAAAFDDYEQHLAMASLPVPTPVP
ncbi:hypothetical protein PybrP1_003849 [[Pythium] brassicae (nom. inval.)]|nr:hypothetical protein PybrP1_003849 [[Pythium] brassicae (nom. inval.)]